MQHTQLKYQFLVIYKKQQEIYKDDLKRFSVDSKSILDSNQIFKLFFDNKVPKTDMENFIKTEF